MHIKAAAAKQLHRVQAATLALPLCAPPAPAKGAPPAALRPPRELEELDAAAAGRLSEALAAGDFTGASGQQQIVYPGEGVAAKRLLLLGLGRAEKLDADGVRRAAGRAVRAARGQKGALAIHAAGIPGNKVRAKAAAQALTEGALLGGYRFNRYQKGAAGEDAAAKKTPPEEVLLLVENAGKVRGEIRVGTVAAESQMVARDLSNEPPNVLTPAELAKRAQAMAEETGLQCRVMEPAELLRRKMGALMAVAQGSQNTPRLIVLEHNAPKGGAGGTGAGKARGRRRKTVCLVGKGVCFDSGGLSLKPATAMVKMKHDMSGGAAVVGALRAAALLKLPLHVVGIVGAVENMPDGGAYRVDDILQSAAGKTIEVTNTDAEGRLVLADCLHYAQQEFAPDVMVDLATLTGAVNIALGPWAAAVMANNAALAKRIQAAGEQSGERYWPLPLWDVHRKHMRSKIADVRQTGGREAGSVTAGAFLWHWVGDVPWAHLDIASVADSAKGTPTHAPGATGFGVRSLVAWLQAGA